MGTPDPNRAEKSRHRQELLASLRTLLQDVPGCTTSWEEIEAALARRLPVEILAALAYRVEAARRQSFDEGVLVAEGKEGH